jgi:hypothetical protein
MVRKLTYCVVGDDEVASRSIRTPSVPRREIIKIVPMKALTSIYYIHRETKTERKRAREIKKEGSEG